MKRILLDTDVLLDIALQREPFFTASSNVFSMLKGDYIGCLTATTITNLYYIIRKRKGHVTALDIINTFVKNENIEILTVDEQVILQALRSGISDFEDSIQISAAIISGVDIIITRNIRDFQNVPIRVLTPNDFIALQ